MTCRLAPSRSTSVVLALLVALCPALAASSEDGRETRLLAAREALGERWAEFLDQTALILSERELDVFLALDRDYRRAAFVDAFWRAHDPFPESPANELRDALEAGSAAARERFGESWDARRPWMVLHGAPERTERISCDLLHSLELWHYRSSPVVRGEFWLVFLRRGGDWRRWSPAEGLWPLMLRMPSAAERQAVPGAVDPLDVRASADAIARQCSQGERLLEALALSLDWEAVSRQAPLLAAGSDEWVGSFLARSTELPEGAVPLAADVEIDYPGRHQSRTVVQALIEVEPPKAPPAADTRRLIVDGEVLRQDELFESFRYRFDLPGDSSTSPPLLFQRYLRPGDYQLILRVHDTASDRYFTQSLPLEVPRVARPSRQLHEPELAPDPAAIDLSEANATLDRRQGELPDDLEPEAGRHRVVLQAPTDELVTGRLRLHAEVTGSEVDRVAFAVDGTDRLSKARPPYSVEIDLGRAPTVRTVAARALDREGRVLAEDELVLNRGPHRFAVRLVEPLPGQSYRRSVRAVAETEVPELERLDRVEFYLNDTLVATVYQPPFVQPVLIPEGDGLSYVRAVGYLESGASAEDVVFVNAPDLVDSMNVNMVELFTTVLDRRGRIQDDLREDEFRVLEQGREMTIRRFQRVDDVPIHAGILLDTSTSMDDRLGEAVDAALHFFEQVLAEGDRACLITFNDRPELVVPFTGNVEVLAGGLAQLSAEGETSLYDSLIYSLFYFGGLKGKRALILLSDGEDSNSEYSFDEALEFARRAGVAIYTIGLAISPRDVDVRHRLERWARETGGETFFIDTAAGLKRIYGQIEEELRSQYLLTYQSSSSDDDEEFREVEVEVLRPGLRAKTMRGYYP